MRIVMTKDLCKVYGKGETAVQALKSVNIEVEQGEFVAIAGASGSGKSTLLHMLGAVDLPTSGKVLIENRDIYKESEKGLSVFRRRKIGFVFQFYNLIPVLTAEENIKVPLSLDGKEPDPAFLNELIDTLGLTERRNHLPNQLSGGQQQRVAIGRAIIHKPAIVLADEPTGNLDTQNGREIITLLKNSVRKFGQTLILITHDPAIAAQADRVIRMQDGQVVEGRARA
ncbi:ABC transporter ATP-binding protein [Ethanoligenens harbinense]|nr:ABC transporter ATP-binding protein [Ethanoligenens harbinense]AVQ96454.1 ABC transporter ATP-binding protein [Ethanoligenens harbinense YUAN-3]AYF39113.1 ABC transporter ATP-binding protein [Ethanoligenens harbinense]AYF41939.1 ABC transporter ATP-binding protein [Ethanoligenens harbinense]QCN92695.1 ABC transporter ATP-binding protein [Ethanoligenens harbinense]